MKKQSQKPIVSNHCCSPYTNSLNKHDQQQACNPITKSTFMKPRKYSVKVNGMGCGESSYGKNKIAYSFPAGSHKVEIKNGSRSHTERLYPTAGQTKTLHVNPATFRDLAWHCVCSGSNSAFHDCQGLFAPHVNSVCPFTFDQEEPVH